MCLLSLVACCCASLFDWWGEKKVEEERQVYMNTLSNTEQEYVKKLDELYEPAADDISFKMIRRIPADAWLLFAITTFFYMAILNFYQVASDIMQNTGGFISPDTASLYTAIPNFVAIIGSPLGGFTVDRIGRALNFIMLACAMLIVAHVAFLALAYGWVSFSPVPVMIWLGWTYSIGASCLWPILAFIVDKEALGTGYGCMTSVQNFGLAVFALVVGKIQDAVKNDGVVQYTIPIFMFIGCATIALILTFILVGRDRLHGVKLNASAAERQARMQQEQAANEQKQTNQSNNQSFLSVQADPKSSVNGQ
jgi:MFS family permease